MTTHSGLNQEVEFIVDYQGWVTGERWFERGTRTSFDEDVANKLIEDGRAIPVMAEATDAAIELALKHGLNLSGMTGSGKGGRIIVGDVQEALEEPEKEE